MTPNRLASRGLVEVEEVNLQFLLFSGKTTTYIEASTGVGARIPPPRCATIDLLAIVATAGA